MIYAFFVVINLVLIINFLQNGKEALTTEECRAIRNTLIRKYVDARSNIDDIRLDTVVCEATMLWSLSGYTIMQIVSMKGSYTSGDVFIDKKFLKTVARAFRQIADTVK
jgi:hypothetical protein